MNKQTLQFILVNPNKINIKTLINATNDLPVRIICSFEIEDIKIIDSHIVINKKKNE